VKEKLFYWSICNAWFSVENNDYLIGNFAKITINLFNLSALKHSSSLFTVVVVLFDE